MKERVRRQLNPWLACSEHQRCQTLICGSLQIGLCPQATGSLALIGHIKDMLLGMAGKNKCTFVAQRSGRKKCHLAKALGPVRYLDLNA